MLRRLLLFVAISVVAVPAMGQDVIYAEAEVAYFKVKNADGSWSEVRGGSIPITIRAIKATKPNQLPPPLSEKVGKRGGSSFSPGLGNWSQSRSKRSGRFSGGSGFFGDNLNTTVYQNDLGAAFVGADSNSVLDDLVLISGSEGQAWKTVTMGVHLATTSRTGLFLVRWKGYDTFTTGLGIGVSAFSGLFFDFGFYLDRADFPAEDETFEVFLDLTLNPVFIVPNRVCYFAQQFREPQLPEEHGEGAFTSTWNVFADAGPQVGTSEDLFFFDFPPDGIYDETEADNFGGAGPGAGNFRLNIQISAGETYDLNPVSFNWFRGLFQSGTLVSLWFDDSSYNVARAFITLNNQESPAQIIVETFVPSTDITSLRFDVDAKANTVGLTQRIEMFNYVTDEWDVIDETPARTTDTRTIVFAANPADYVDPGTFKITTKISWYETGIIQLYPWTISVDQVHWTVTTP